MSLGDTLTAIKARVHDRGSDVVAKEVGVHVDTLRSILSADPPKWLKTYRRLEELASTPATGAAETGGEAS